MRSSLTLILTSLTLLVSSCGLDSSVDERMIARPVAYPRPKLCDTTYAECNLPARFMVNAAATAIDKTPADRNNPTDPQWIDIVYPTYQAAIHCTFIPIDSTDSRRNEIILNRNERMMLNLGDNFAEQTELTSANGAETLILTTTGASLTPIQFLSVTPRWIISGSLQFEAASVKPDSVMPIVDAVKTDIIHAARNL